MKIFVPEAEVPDAKQVALVHQQVAETIQRLPGVGGSGLVSTIPMANEGAYDDFLEVEEFPVAAGQAPGGVPFKWISPGYLESMGIPLMSGRVFGWRDVHQASPVVLVSTQPLPDSTGPSQDRRWENGSKRVLTTTGERLSE